MSKEEPDPSRRTVWGRLSRFRRALGSFFGTYAPKSFSDLCSGGSALAAVSGAVVIGYGIWQFDTREREAREIRDFSFFFPSVEDLGVDVNVRQVVDAYGDMTMGYSYELSWRFKNTGNLPLLYHPKIVGYGRWSDKGNFEFRPPFGEDGEIDPYYLFSSNRIESVGPGSDGRALVSKIESHRPPSGTVYCLYMSVDFEPILNRTQKALFAEHDPKDYAHTITRTGAFAAPGTADAHLKRTKQDRVRDDADGICAENFSQSIVMTYANIWRKTGSLDHVSSFRSSIERAHPNLLIQTDLELFIPRLEGGGEE